MSEFEPSKVTVLYRPVGPKELELIRSSGNRAFPPRLPEQPIFYPVTTREYAARIARDWNARGSDGEGFVTQFAVETSYLSRFDLHAVGGREHQEYWTPADELAEFNGHVVGEIEVVEQFVAAEGAE